MDIQYKEISLEQALFLYDSGFRDFQEKNRSRDKYDSNCLLNQDGMDERSVSFWSRYRLFVPVE